MAGMPNETEPVMSVRDLRIVFRSGDSEVTAVDGVSFDIYPEEIFSIVGESGSGKSVTAMSILGLIDPPGRVEATSITFAGRDLRGLSEREFRRIRGNEVAMIFQDPMTALNPLFTVVEQIAEALMAHSDIQSEEATQAAIDSLSDVGIPNASKRVNDYPHQFSGGMRQRAMIAMSMITKPRLLIADEPTTALDVTIQAQILDVLKDIVTTQSTSVLLITHDLGVVASVADRVMVMYAGQVHETGSLDDVFYHPAGPYSWGLMDSVPRLDGDVENRLSQIGGHPASAGRLPAGCRFHPRCPYSQESCESAEPSLISMSSTHSVRCHFAAEPGWRSKRRRRIS